MGVEHEASGDAIRQRYLALAKVLHPDVCKRSTATQEFKALKQAYDTLKDPETRQHHNYALAKVATAGVADDIVDEVLQDYGLTKPKKKKKKKKKQPVVNEAELAQQRQAQAQFQTYQPPPYQPPPPQYSYDDRRGRGEFEGIPPGFDNNDNLGGIL